jgi:hypothetical protein
MQSRLTLVKQIFEAACAEPPSERFAFLAQACGDDQSTRREVESLLAFYDDAPAAEPQSPARRRSKSSNARYRRGHVLAGRYRIDRWLGAGGMGEVYAVYDGLLRQTVALKALHRADSLLRKRLIEEVRLARLVTHPGVCRVYDVGEDAGALFLTMELIDGEDLATRLERSGALPSAEVVHIGARLAAALAAAHEAGVLHRDLKPANILIARTGGIYITDFGIATSRGRTDEGASGLGTPAYMSPEETEPHGVVTERSDLYSLGLILYEISTGAPAFHAPDMDALLAMQRSASPEPPSRFVHDIDPPLEALILRLLEKDPEQRPQSARAALAALEEMTSSPLDTASRMLSPERRHIVSLTCRLAGPSKLTTHPDWRALGRIFQARATASCRRHGGGIHRHLPDGLVVHFGVASASERDAEAAVRAGLEIVADLEQRPLIETDRGFLTTTVVVDSVTATVRGRHVITAERRAAKTNRVESSATNEVARADAVMVGGALMPLLSHTFDVEPIDSTDGERRFRVLGLRDGLGLRLEASRLTPLANRHLDLARLERWWQDARAGRGQVVLLQGEAGIGKSRTVHELWQRTRGEGIALEGPCSSFHPSTPLHPFVQMITSAAGLDAADDGDTREAKLRRLFDAAGPRAGAIRAVFSSWLSPPSLAGPATASDTRSEKNRQSFIAAIHEWIAALAEIQPILVVCEDLHWSDATSREAIDGLIDVALTSRVLLVLTFRPSFTPPWKRTGLNQLVVQPLAPDEAHALIAAIPDHAVRAAEAIVERAEGNPLYLEELVHHEHEARSTSGSAALPLSLRGLFASRLDRLGTAKRVAQAAAVCDRTFRYELLLAVHGDGNNGSDLDASLARLVDAEILFQRGPLPRATFTWKHGLLREAAYASLPPRERRRMHAAAASDLSRHDPETVASRPGLIAHHWTEAGRPVEALEWWQRAGLRALERSAYVEARHDLEQALRALRRTDVSGGERRRRELELELALTTTEMLEHGSGSNEAARRARRAEVLCRGAALDDQIAEALYLTARIRIVRGELGTARRMLAPLAAMNEAIASPYLRSAVLAQAGNYLACNGELADAGSAFDRAVAAYDRTTERAIGAYDPLTHLQFMRGLVSWLRGRQAESRRYIESGIAHTDAVGTQGAKAVIPVNAAPLALLSGDRAWFAKLVRDALRLAMALRSSYLVNAARVFAPLAEAALSADDREQQVRAALADSERSGYRLFRSLGLAELAALEAARGRSEEALLTFEQAMAEAARRTDRFLLPEILRRRAELLIDLGRRAEARDSLRKSLRGARRSGAFALELRAALSLSRLLADEGRSREANGVLRSTLARIPADVDVPERAEAERRVENPVSDLLLSAAT